MERGYWKVKEWFFDKVADACRNYGMMIIGEYKDGMLDHTILRVNEVLFETEKAYKVAIECETYSGDYKEWQTYIPKSVIL